MKRTAIIILALTAVLALALPAYADTYKSTGNGAEVIKDDGSRIVYNGRSSTITFYNWLGVVEDEYEVQLSESQFKSQYYRSGSSSRSSSNDSRYAYAQVNNAFWASGSHYTAKWDAGYQSSGKYTVTLYRDGHKVKTASTSKGAKSHDFTSDIASANKTGSYYFTVKGNWSGYTDEATSEDVWVDTYDLNRIRGYGSSSSGSSSSGTSGYVYNSNSAGPGATPANTPGPGIAAGWQNVGGIWKYMRPNGTYAANCWEAVNGKWYYFDANGNMAANQWIATDAWYYVGPDGDMQTNLWVQSRSNEHIWYYVGADGKMVTNTVVNGWPINAAGECYY